MSVTNIIYLFFLNKVSEQFSSHCIFFFSNYCIITNFTPVFSYINNTSIVIRGTVIHAKTKKAYIEVTLHSVCEFKEFGQVTVE